jgi:TatD DNase family protein
MRFFDTHCHLDDEQFDDNRQAVIHRAEEAGVVGMVAIGTTAESSQKSCDLARRKRFVYAAVGIQPNYCAEAKDGDWDGIVALTRNSNVVAIGETGLDRYWDHAPFDLQQDYFSRHIQLSQQTELPFIVHMRDCETDILKALETARRRGPLRGVMHSFTGSHETAHRCLEYGLHISFAGMVTYRKSAELREVAQTIPPDRLLIETDAPYLSPHPKRGQRPNEPALVVHTAACLAETCGVDLELLAEQTTANAAELFRVRV